MSGSSRVADSLAVVLLVLVPLVVLDTARAQSLTCDEAFHLGAAFSSVEHGRVVLNREHPPLAKLVAGASLHLLGVREGDLGPVFAAIETTPDLWAEAGYGEALVFSENPDLRLPLTARGPDSVLLAARAPMAGFAFLAALAALLWARSRFGPWGGLVTLALVATYPDLLGHAALLTFDAPLAAWSLLLGFALDRVARGGGTRWLVLLGLAVGGALATKFSAVFLVLGAVLAALVALARPIDVAAASLAHPLGQGSLRERARSFALAVLVVASLAYLVLWASYLGAEPLASYRRGIATLSATYSPPFDGICFGHSSTGPWWHYFLVAVALKAPLGSLILLVVTVVVLARRSGPPSSRGSLTGEVLLHAAAIVFFVATSILARPFGSRYVLAAVLGAFVSAGRLGPWAQGSRARAALLVACLSANLVGVVREHPYHQSATNLLAGSPMRVFEKLDDSNQDWGGGLKALGVWQRERGVARLHVLPFAARPFLVARGGERPFLLNFPPTFFYSWTAHFEAWGVHADVVRGDVLFRPQASEVYAISAHAEAWGRAAEDEWRKIAATCGQPAPPLVLGDGVAPSELVGGSYLIFDLRDKQAR